MIELNYYTILILTGALLFIGIILTKPSSRYGIPALILYLLVGLSIGNGGVYDFVYDYPQFTERYSILSISIIIFVGGLGTKLEWIKPVLKEGIALSSIGVIVSASIIALFSVYIFKTTFFEGLLLGTVLSSTDAAAVFSIFQSKELKLKENISETLELESGTNDPLAYFMTISLTAFLAGEDVRLGGVLLDFFVGIFVALIFGYFAGKFIVFVIRKINLENRGLYPILLLALVIFSMGFLPLVKGNLLLAMYVLGITVGNHPRVSRKIYYPFFESISWIMEISLFLLLGLQFFPSEIYPYLDEAFLITLFMLFIARPSAVFLLYLFSKASIRKRIFISWVGLRGATPVVFGFIPLSAGVEFSSVILNVVLVVVIVSVMVQGSTLGWLARKLELNK